MSSGFFEVEIGAVLGTAGVSDGIASDASAAGSTGSSAARTASGAAGDGPLAGALAGFAAGLDAEASALHDTIAAIGSCLRACATNYTATDDTAFQTD